MLNTKERYEKGELTKKEFVIDMYEFHKNLFNYPDLMKQSDIDSIEISNGRVIMKTNNSIKMLCKKGDKHLVPLTILNFGAYEPNILSFIKRMLKSGDTFFDIGSNVGWYIMNVAKDNWEIDIYAFEPIPQTFEMLRENLELNSGLVNSKKIYPLNLGLSDVSGAVEFFYLPEICGATSIKNISPGYEHIKVSCNISRMDSFVKYREIKKIDLIKCDVEGAELLVFRGGENSIREHKPIICCEMFRKWSAKFDYHPNDIISFLGGIGYNCYAFRDGKLVQMETMTEEEMETDFVFLHKDKHLENVIIREYLRR